jgi:CheY-like chemotaxis protein/signal transduction histidine kinase/HAMP domain-containing protein
MRLSLREKFSIPAVLLFIVGMVISTLVSHYNLKKAAETTIDEGLEQISSSTMALTRLWLTGRKNNFVSWSESKVFISALEGVNKKSEAFHELIRLQNEYTFFSYLGLIKPDGTLLASSNPDFLKEPNFKELEFFDMVLDGEYHFKTLKNLSLVKNRKISQSYVEIAAPVWGEEDVVGIFVGYLNLGSFCEKHIKPIKVGESGYSILFDDHGIVLQHKNIEVEGLKSITEYGYSKKILDTTKKRFHYVENDEEGEKYIFLSRFEDIGWTLGLSVPTKELYESADRLMWTNLWIGLGAFLVMAIILLFMARRVVKPLEQAIKSMRKVSQGDLSHQMEINSTTIEIDELTKTLNEMIDIMRERAELASSIAVGDLSRNVRVTSEQDQLGKALKKMVDGLMERAYLAESIARGDLSVPVKMSSEYDLFGEALQLMVSKLKSRVALAEDIADGKLDVEIEATNESDMLGRALEKMVRQLQLRMAFKNAQTELMEQIRGEQDVVGLCRVVITCLAKFLDAQIGLLYLHNGDSHLEYTAGYAFDSHEHISDVIEFGQGVVGQAAVEKDLIILKDIGDSYFKVCSALGNATPKYIVVAPMVYDGHVRAVVELGSFEEFTPEKIDFLRSVSESIAIAISVAHSRATTRELLEKTMDQADRLVIQQDELQHSNEELEEQALKLKKSEERLKTQQEELQATNEELEEKTRILEKQKREVQDKNQELEAARLQLSVKADELGQASKYKSEFLANMSHELRTPLNSLLILAQSLIKNKTGNLEEDQLESMKIIHNSGCDLLNLINEILDLAKIEAGRMQVNVEEVAITDICMSVERNFAHVAEERGLDLIVNLAPDLPKTIHTDMQKLSQIIKNLVSNALKFTHEGSVTVDISRPPASLVLTTPGLNRENGICVCVTDTGVGIPEEHQFRVFEAFQQVDGSDTRKFAGTGLGLSISKELAHLLGGEITLKSIVGRGSIFSLVIMERLESDEPDYNETSVGVYPAPSPISINTVLPENSEHTSCPVSTVEYEGSSIEDDRDSLVNDKPIILIIEDDMNFARILYRFCSDRDYQCLHASLGKDAVKMAQKFVPGAIILDMNLPDMYGTEIMEALRLNPKTRHIPVHVISAEDVVSEIINKGAVGFLTKPVDSNQMEDLFQKIESRINKKIKDVLLVEDDQVLRKCLEGLFNEEEIAQLRVQGVGTGKEALDALENSMVDCMILDLSLPDISGFEVLKRMRQRPGFKPPVIIHTGRELSREEEFELYEYADSIIVKAKDSEERLLSETALFLHSSFGQSAGVEFSRAMSEDEFFDGKTVLVVDDDMRNVFAVSRILEDKKFKVLKASNGQKALEQLEKHSEVDIVLMDIMMPVMDGYQAMTKIRENPQFAKLPILALTAKAMKEDREKCINAGASDYMSKPLDVDRLLSLMRVWLSQ